MLMMGKENLKGDMNMNEDDRVIEGTYCTTVPKGERERERKKRNNEKDINDEKEIM